MRKHSIDYIREQVEKEGFKLLSDEYFDAHSKLNIVCPNNHSFEKSFNKWTKGQRCKYCNNYITHVNDLDSSFKKEGYVLLTNHYNKEEVLHYICSKGHKSYTTVKNWNIGVRCRKCHFENITFAVDSFIAMLEKEGYKIISELGRYKNSKSILVCECPKGHTYKTSRNKWINGYRCKECAYKNLAKKYKYSYNYIKDKFKAEGYTLLSKNYTNAFEKLKYKCPNNHISYIKYNDWQQGYRCRFCYLDKNRGPNHPNWRGGVSFEPYCEVWKDKEYKESIKERDKFICQNPYCYGNSKKLVVHHINYIKKDCRPKNLITVCDGCNKRANYNRNWHKEWYQILMNRRFGFNYEK